MPDTKTLFLNRQAGSHLFCSEIEDWQIHVSAQAGPSERYAAEEFQYWFEMTSGNRLTLTNTKTGDGQIQIESAEGSTGVNQSESFQIEVAPDLVKITGSGGKGNFVRRLPISGGWVGRPLFNRRPYPCAQLHATRWCGPNNQP